MSKIDTYAPSENLLPPVPPWQGAPYHQRFGYVMPKTLAERIEHVANRVAALSDVSSLSRPKARNAKRSRPVALINIGQTIKLARELAKLNQRQLAEKMGVVRSYVTRVEGGLVEPNLESLLRFGDALGIPAWKLLRRAERTAERG